jgi:hypothetical protein
MELHSATVRRFASMKDNIDFTGGASKGSYGL